MAIRESAVGNKAEPVVVSWSSSDALLYALAVGAGVDDPTGAELEFTTENLAGLAQRVFRLLLSSSATPSRNCSQQPATSTLQWSCMVSSPSTLACAPAGGGQTRIETEIVGIYDKEYRHVDGWERLRTSIRVSSTRMWTNRSSAFLRGYGGFGGRPGPPTRNMVPSRPPDRTVSYVTRTDQALLYRLCGDRNPLHSDPAFARAAGFDRPILHGLCTFGFTGRALLHGVGNSDPACLLSMSGRFTAPVYPGETLIITRSGRWLKGLSPSERLHRPASSSTTGVSAIASIRCDPMTAVRCGIHTPVVILLPGFSATWEADATIEDVAKVATAAERLGYDHVTCSEHVGIPSEVAAVRGARYSGIARRRLATCRRSRDDSRLATNVLVLGYHHPLEIAKRYGTLDRVSNGRLILGLGVGSLKEEFDLLGVAFEDRGRRADEALRALRGSLSQERPAFDGEFYRYSDMIVDPPALQPRVPLWIGGRTARSLRRAVELGDGWVPFGLSAERLASLLEVARATTAWNSRQEPLEVILTNDVPIDPSGDPEEALVVAERLVAAGATMLQLHLRHRSLDHLLEQLDAMSRLPVFAPLRPQVDGS